MLKYNHWQRAAASMLIAGMFAGCAAPATPTASPEPEATEAASEVPTELATDLPTPEPTLDLTHDPAIQGPVMALTYILHLAPESEQIFKVIEDADSPGDMLVFANTVYDETNTRELGKDHGVCVRMSEHGWECLRTLTLINGTVTAQGLIPETNAGLMAITGGTGDYNRASGQLELYPQGEAEISFEYTLPMTRKQGELLRFEVIERLDTNTIQQIGEADDADSVGDMMTFNNPLLDESGAEIGTDQGMCIRTIVGEVWHCVRTFALPEGQVVAQGIQTDTRREFAIVGGTGAYANASGQLSLRDGTDDTSYEVRFELFEWESTAEVFETGGSDRIQSLPVIHNSESEEDAAGNLLVLDGQSLTDLITSGMCFRIVVGESWLCHWTLNWGDHIIVTGVLHDAVDSALAITGGTTVYGAATGEVTLKVQNPDEMMFEFLYRISE